MWYFQHLTHLVSCGRSSNLIIKGILYQPYLLTQDVYDIKTHRRIHHHVLPRHVITCAPADIQDLLVIDGSLVSSVLIIMAILHLDETEIPVSVPRHDIKLREPPTMEVPVHYPVSPRLPKTAGYIFHLRPDLTG